jgi:sterol desaturase/sphingolipid hydroxylase (fatty acid hydroxylase superfamily)
MTNTAIILVTLGILLAGNSIALVYSWLVLYTDVFKKLRLQDKKYKPRILFQRLPLILLNLTVLAGLTTVSLYFFADTVFETSLPVWWLIPVQVVFIFIIDDAWFYFAHRLMHENKFLLRKIHSIHHQAITPFPLEYIYVHPLEWMIGSVGSFLGLIALMMIMPVNIYAFWVYGIIRNLHEVEIHSDLRSPISKYIPFLNPTESHDLHHSKVKGNYASMFTIWDRVFGTVLTKD